MVSWTSVQGYFNTSIGILEFVSTMLRTSVGLLMVAAMILPTSFDFLKFASRDLKTSWGILQSASTNLGIRQYAPRMLRTSQEYLADSRNAL